MDTLNHRKKEILTATISNYINSAEPVGSGMLKETAAFPYSSATIRNELNELEKGGFLAHLHTSSGRVPTDKGYRLYVDALMDMQNLSAEQQKLLTSQFLPLSQNIFDVLTRVTQIMSNIIDYTFIVLTPDVFRETMKAVHLILLDLNKVLVVLLNAAGVSQEFLVQTKQSIAQEDLNKISKLLTEKLEGKNFYHISKEDFTGVIKALPAYKAIIEDLVKATRKAAVYNRKNQRLLTSGISKMLKLPEFNNIELARNVLESLEDNKLLCQTLTHYLQENDLKVVIGHENKVSALEDCSMVLAPYKIENEALGAIGVLGPTRMAYPYVVPLVENIVGMVNAYLKNNLK